MKLEEAARDSVLARRRLTCIQPLQRWLLCGLSLFEKQQSEGNPETLGSGTDLVTKPPGTQWFLIEGEGLV